MMLSLVLELDWMEDVSILVRYQVKIDEFINGRRIYPFNKGLWIYGGYTTILFTRLYFYSRYEVETLQVVKLAFLI